MIVLFSRRHLSKATFLIGAMFAAQAQAQLTPTPPPPAGNVFFDYFLADNLGQPANNFGSSALPTGQFLQWTVADGTVDLLGGTTVGVDDLPGGRYVDLDGSTNDAGRFSTRASFAFAPLVTYELFFEYASQDGQPNTADVTVAGKTFTVSTSQAVAGSQANFLTFRQAFTVNAATTSNISFQDRGNDSAGIAIDAVLLNVVAPEPATLSAVAASAAIILRRRRIASR